MSAKPHRPSASLVLVAPDDEGGILVSLAQRSKAGTFGGMVVFPGGAVDPADEAGLKEVLAQPAHASLDSADAGPRFSALREALEEVGVPLLIDSVGATVSLSAEDLAVWRRDVHLKASTFSQKCCAKGWAPNLRALHPVCRFKTPEIEAQRMKKGGFDTHFFAVVLETLPKEAAVDGKELKGSLLWISPEEALRRAKLKEIEIMPPQYFILHKLSGYSLEGLKEMLAGDTLALERAVPFQPRPVKKSGGAGFDLVLPGDAEHHEFVGPSPESRHRFVMASSSVGGAGWGVDKLLRSSDVAAATIKPTAKL